ncbi:hypothetical protein Bca52824_028743 [Brassica carinata]|uniref:GBF-interacting protein 1 N-terminal domain-containing protein n=1 Tax=Brassica carinata TaxID=52824 RepID=A0A8X8ANI6_BRACI|nr:hypothetical protein Bca52824_028743 [Brassica carinata]
MSGVKIIDPFHEVKSKKDKKKEVRDIQDSRPRGYSNNYNRGTRGGSDRYAGPRRTGASSFNSSVGKFPRKTTNKRESEKQTYGGSFSSTSGVPSHHQIPHSDSVAVDSKTPTVNSGDGISSSQPVSAQQTPWLRAAGQMSMADIVKMGRPHNKTINSQKKVSEVNQEHETVKDQWPSIEKPMAASTSSVSVAPTESVRCNGPADLPSSGGDQQLKGHLEDTHLAENGPFGNLGRDHVQADTIAGGVVPDDESEVSSEFDDNPHGHQTQNHPVEHQKDEDIVSSVAANLQELSIENHDKYSSHEEDRPAVLIPDHLLIYSEECSQLSFGSFGSRPLNNNLEEASDVAPQIERADARNTEFYGDEQLGSTSHGNMVHASTAENYDDSSESQQEALLPENPETAHQQNQYSFAQSDQEYAYENAKQQTNTEFDASQTSMQNQIASLTNVMQGYSNATPNTLLGQTAQSARELELQYSTFPGAQSMPSRSNDYSLNDQSISMPEALRDGGGIQTTQASQQQNLPGANIATGPALPQGPQQLPMHPYSQHTVPLTHFANMISYPLMPQGYPYLPSAFQQAFSGNSSYHQSPLLPQYKNNISPSNLPPSATSAPFPLHMGLGIQAMLEPETSLLTNNNNRQLLLGQRLVMMTFLVYNTNRTAIFCHFSNNNSSRMKTRLYGFMDLVLKQCRVPRAMRTTTFRHNSKLSNFVKLSNRRSSNMDRSVTQTTISHKPECQWSTNSETQGRVAPKPSPRSKHRSSTYGKTLTRRFQSCSGLMACTIIKLITSYTGSRFI